MDARLMNPVHAEVLRARMLMQKRDPWYAPWVAATRWYEVPDADGKPVLATDESCRVYVSPAALVLPLNMLAWLLRHEADHWFHRHFDSRERLIQALAAAGSPDPHREWNFCADAPINAGISESYAAVERGWSHGLLKEAQKAEVWGKLKELTGIEAITHGALATLYPDIEGALYVEVGHQTVPAGTEHLVKALCAMHARRQQQQQQQQQAGSPPPQQGQGNPQPGQGQPGPGQPGQSSPPSDPNGAGQPSAGQPQPGQPDPNAQPGQAAPQPGQGQPVKGPPMGPGGLTAGCGADLPYVPDSDPAPLGKRDIEALANRCLDRAMEVAQDQRDGNGQPGQSSVPLSVRGLIKAREDARSTAHTVDWTAILESNLTDALRRVEDGGVAYRYGEPEPIRCDPLLLAGRVKVAPEILLVLDASGSMSSYLDRVAGQVAQAVDRCGGRCLVSIGDTDILGFMEYEAGDTLPLSAAGGTSMETVVPLSIERVGKEGHEPAVCVLITDGETGYPAQGQMRGLPLHVVLVKKDTARWYPIPKWASAYDAWEVPGK